MSSCFYLKFYLFLISIIISFSGCTSHIASIEKQQNYVFKVNDPNASYFNIQDRRQFLQGPNHNIRNYSRSLVTDCSLLPNLTPINYLVVPPFYKNRYGWEKATAPITMFENTITNVAELYMLTEREVHAQCLAKILFDWAENDSFLSFDYQGNDKQAWFTVEWAATSAAMAYSIIKESESITPKIKLKIENWLENVAIKQTRYPGGPTSCCNNHSYWRGLEATIIGVVSNNNKLFRYGIHKYLSALSSMSRDGSFPLEMSRGNRALHYQNFAILPLIYIAEIAYQQGYNLYDIEIKGKSIHLAIDFLMACIDDQEILEEKTGRLQDRKFLVKKREVNWMEPYINKYPNKSIEKYLNNHRPISHRWSGGNSTLYFYNPSIK